jgi:hypothetical protein
MLSPMLDSTGVTGSIGVVMTLRVGDELSVGKEVDGKDGGGRVDCSE